MSKQKDVLKERDRRYEERFVALEKILSASILSLKELNSQAFAASEKAIVKAEEAQRAYNERSNEFRGQLDDQAHMLVPRAEADAKFSALEIRIEDVKKQVNELRESRSQVEGKDKTHIADRQQINWVIGLAVGILGSIIVVLIGHFLK